MPAAARKRPPREDEDVLSAIERLHSCLHNVGERVDGIQADITHMRSDIGKVEVKVARVEGYQEGIATKLRVPAAGETMSFWRRWKTPIATAGAVFGAFTAFATAYPLLRGLLLALDAYLSAAR